MASALASALVEQDDYFKSLAVEAVKGNDNSFMDRTFLLVFITVPVQILKIGNIKANAWRKISELLDLEESKL